jgi:hypothetical protein
MAKLLVQEAAGVREYELLNAETPIGRGKANALRLPHPSISNRHCVIHRTPKGFEVQDLHSSNGVVLNSKRINTGLLKDGDRMDLGEIRLTFKDAPPAELGRTVAIIPGVLEPPRVTVRLRAEDLAEFHGNPPPLAPSPALAAPKVPSLADQDTVSLIVAGQGVAGHFQGANLVGANLKGVNLERANLNDADLSGANLKEANLSGATLKNANLEDANLKGANLERANLRNVNLKGTVLVAANLEGANLEGARY